MSVSCGIVGLPNVGKSTIFNALTAAQAEQGNYPFCTIDPNVAVVEVPDDNLATINRFIDAKRLMPAVLNVVDIAGLIAGASKGEGMGNKFLANIRECDAVMHVVRCFEGSSVVREDPVDPQKDMEVIELELALADLDTVVRAVERVSKKARSGDKDSLLQKALFERAQAMLEVGTMVRAGDWTTDERKLLQPLCLMTFKDMLYVANVSDEDLDGASALAQVVAERAVAQGAQWIPICGDIESELRGMEPDERELFMGELGIEKLGLNRLIQATYELLGLQTYYTAGEKEIRAWTCHVGDKAPRAAGVIHTDFENQFIRAEVYSVPDLVEFESEAQIRAAGRLRTEGRDYPMQDGDVCHFLIGK